jgi:hypothetical protein
LWQAVEDHMVLRCRGSLIFSRYLAQSLRWGCQPYAPATLYPQEDSWYPFLLEAESPQGHSAAGRISYIEKIRLIGNEARYLPVYSTVPQPTTLPRSHIYVCICLYTIPDFLPFDLNVSVYKQLKDDATNGSTSILNAVEII